MNKRIASAVVGASLVLGLAGCADKASDDFKDRCDKAGGEVKRDSETLGMSSVSFVVKGGGKGGGSRGSSSSKGKSFKKSSGGSTKNGSGSKPSKIDDDEWVCAKDGVELFEEN